MSQYSQLLNVFREAVDSNIVTKAEATFLLKEVMGAIEWDILDSYDYDTDSDWEKEEVDKCYEELFGGSNYRR